MINRLVIFSLLALLMLNVVACSGGSTRITVGEINPSKNAITGEYHSFSGHYFKKVKLKDGETLIVKFSAETEKGELIAKIIGSEENTIKTLNTGDTVTLNQPDQYKLQVEGEKHRGKFTLTWEKE